MSGLAASLVLGAVALVGGARFPSPALAQQAGPAGAYTADQEQRGRAAYAAHCAACHGAELEGGVAPALAGAAFAQAWGRPDRTVEDLFYVMRSSMPRPASGSLPDETYLDLLAHILKRNGFASGSRALAASGGALKTLRVAAAGALAADPKTPPAFIGGARGTPTGSGPNQAELDTAAARSDWLHHNRDYAGTRYSPLAQIDRSNAGRLAVACLYQLGSTETFQTGPLVQGGIMYLTTARLTAAIDAATCRERWRHQWSPQDEALWPNNRGVALKDGYVVRGTPDGYLFALDAATGGLLWARQVAKPALGETITMPPLVVDSLIVIGPAGSENNIQGWIGAFRLSDGQPLWRFNTIPRPGEPGTETWGNRPDVPVGGGSVWTPLSLDRARGELYVPVTNPAPDLPAHLRPGPNLYTNAIVALDARTGKLRWYDQLVPSDFHDWDLTQVSPLFRATVGGRERNVVSTAGKDGVLRLLDRDTHERLFEAEVTTRLNVDAPLGRSGVRFCPGLLGGVEWNGPAYHPGTNLLYVPAVDWCFTARLDDTVRFVPGQGYLGGTAIPDRSSQGWLTAVDASTGAVRWRYRASGPMLAGVTATGGGLVLTGEMGGDFLALDAATGDVLHRLHTGGSMGGGIVTYSVGGRQYVAATSGPAGIVFPPRGSPTVVVFALPDR
jgi:alcohol dehydrogenase (cytochrome c)